MGFTDKFWDTIDKISSPVREQTISEDVTTRRIRQQREQTDRIQRVEYDPETGKPLLWFDVVVSSIGGQTDVPIPWPGTDVEDVRKSFLLWLAEDEWQTVTFTKDGAQSELTFRSSWVSGFQISGKGRARQ